MAPDGSFVIVWQSANDEPSSEGIEIIAQRYDSTGTQVGGPFRANTFQTGNQHLPRMSMDHLGNVVIVWRCSSRQAIIAQRYNAVGGTVGNEFQVNTYTTNNQENPTLAADAMLQQRLLVNNPREVSEADALAIYQAAY